MRKQLHILTTIWVTLATLAPLAGLSQFACNTAVPLSYGGCLNGVSFGGSGSTAGCSGSGYGGGGSVYYMSFTAPANGDCIEFDFVAGTLSGNLETTIWNSCSGGTPTGYVSGTINCITASSPGRPFSTSSRSTTGVNTLTPGNSYIIRVWSKNGGTFDVCLNRRSIYQASDQCPGAIGLSPASATYYNGGDCNFSGSYDNASSGDPAPGTLCAGSLENTQWFTFTASSAGTITITGSNIYCTGGGCGFQFGLFTAGVGGSCAGPLTNLGCASQGPGCGPGPDPSSIVTANPPNRLTWSGVSATGFTVTISGAVAGEVFYFVMDGNADSDCQFDMSATGAIFPVSLLSFTARASGANAILSWTTAVESNSSHFVVYRSTNGYVFDEIGQVAAAGTSQEPVTYRFSDLGLNAPRGYYMFRQYDFDGTYSRSEIVEVKTGERGANVFIGTDHATVVLGEEFQWQPGASVRIHDITGRAAKVINIPREMKRAEISYAGLQPGIYVLTLESGTYRESRKVFVR